MFNVLCKWFLLFLIYSFIGWIIEMVVYLRRYKKVIDRGFLIGPILPLYGFGAILMIIFLGKYSNDIITLFCMSALLCTVLEYLTSYIMEKLFHARWWDYSDMKYNIEGRVRLKNSLLFGLGGVLVVPFVNPFLVSLLSKLSVDTINTAAVIFFIMFAIDVCFSCKVIFSFRSLITDVRKDSSAEINKLVKKMIAKDSIFAKRLVHAFPNLKLNINKLKKKKGKFFKKGRK